MGQPASARILLCPIARRSRWREIMKHVTILAWILCACFVSAAWAQQVNSHAKTHPLRHHAVNQMAPSGHISNPYLVQSNASQNRVWELGTYPGGTWASMGDVNDF